MVVLQEVVRWIGIGIGIYVVYGVVLMLVLAVFFCIGTACWNVTRPSRR
jgi:hypothetical protein